MTSQRLEKWLEAAEDKAAQDGTVNFHRADSRRTFDLLGGRNADESDVDSL
jgi:hypothetical protein